MFNMFYLKPGLQYNADAATAAAAAADAAAVADAAAACR